MKKIITATALPFFSRRLPLLRLTPPLIISPLLPQVRVLASKARRETRADQPSSRTRWTMQAHRPRPVAPLRSHLKMQRASRVPLAIRAARLKSRIRRKSERLFCAIRPRRILSRGLSVAPQCEAETERRLEALRGFWGSSSASTLISELGEGGQLLVCRLFLLQRLA